jgi:hypothetical protein
MFLTVWCTLNWYCSQLNSYVTYGLLPCPVERACMYSLVVKLFSNLNCIWIDLSWRNTAICCDMFVAFGTWVLFVMRPKFALWKLFSNLSHIVFSYIVLELGEHFIEMVRLDWLCHPGAKDLWQFWTRLNFCQYCLIVF